jgi:NAD-dependent DNA ligase
MMFKRILKVLLALGLTLGVCLVAGPSAAQEPAGKQLREAPGSPEADREPVAVLGQKTLYATADTYILEGYPAYNAGTETQMLAGYDEYYDPEGRIARSLVTFDLAGLPVNQKITQASLMMEAEASAEMPQPLAGLTFVLTGTLPTMSRDQAKALIEARGGKVTGSVSKKTDYLLLGENPGSKLAKAQSLGTKITGEKELRELVGS